MKKSAVISKDGRYRYWLQRLWKWPAPRMIFVMLNPSTADAEVDDPTIRRCVRFAKREGCGLMEVVNLYAYRATDPQVLKKVADPIGPKNDWHLRDAFSSPGRIVAAWGGYADEHRASQVIDLLWENPGRGMFCLGTTKNGQPRHPLYLRRNAPVQLFRAEAVA